MRGEEATRQFPGQASLTSPLGVQRCYCSAIMTANCSAILSVAAARRDGRQVLAMTKEPGALARRPRLSNSFSRLL
jgi:hypothetical protein